MPPYHLVYATPTPPWVHPTRPGTRTRHHSLEGILLPWAMPRAIPRREWHLLARALGREVPFGTIFYNILYSQRGQPTRAGRATLAEGWFLGHRPRNSRIPSREWSGCVAQEELKREGSRVPSRARARVRTGITGMSRMCASCAHIASQSRLREGFPVGYPIFIRSARGRAEDPRADPIGSETLSASREAESLPTHGFLLV